jgi:hypothetical protein
MAFTNFKPEIWSTKLLMARDIATIAVQNSWRQWEGDIKAAGDRVHIAGLSGATIKDFTNITIDDPEQIADQSMELVIDQRKYVNFEDEDVDKLQSNIPVMASITKKTGNNYAVVQDQFVYNMALDGAGKTVDAYSTLTTKLNIMDVLSQTFAWIKSNGVTLYGDVFCELHPYIFQLIQSAVMNVQLPNDSVVTNGYKGKLWDSMIYETSVIPCTSDVAGTIPVAPGTAGAYYHCIARTNEAIAFAEQKAMNFESYRKEKGFADGIKALGLYGGKVVRPAELAVIKFKIS